MLNVIFHDISRDQSSLYRVKPWHSCKSILWVICVLFFFFPLDGRQYVSLMRFICWESFLSLSVFGSESVLHSLCSLFTNTDELKSTPTLLFSFFLTYHNTRLTLRWPLTYIVIYFFQACDWLWALVFWEVYIFLKFFWRWKR